MGNEGSEKETPASAAKPADGGVRQGGGQSMAGRVAGWVAGAVALIVVNVIGQGAFIADSVFWTGFVVGGGTFLIVSVIVDLVVRRGRSSS